MVDTLVVAVAEMMDAELVQTVAVAVAVDPVWFQVLVAVLLVITMVQDSYLLHIPQVR